MAKEYFAKPDDLAKLGGSLWSRLESVANSTWYTQRRALYRLAHSAYYGFENGEGATYAVNRAGVQGELASFRLNTGRSNAKALVSIVTAPPLAWRPIARNDDAGAAKSTTLAKNLLEDAWKTRQFARQHRAQVEMALAFAEAYRFVEWNPALGKPMAALDGQVLFEGDAVVHLVPPWDYVTDPRARHPSVAPWCFVRVQKNAYDLAAVTPQLVDGKAGDEARDAILSVTSKRDWDLLTTGNDYTAANAYESELVDEWHFFHAPTPTIPDGLHVVFLSGAVVLRAEPLALGEMPIVPLAPEALFNTPSGWSSYWDTLAPQQISDAIDVMMSSNITNLGNTIVAIEKGSDVTPQRLAGGNKVWPYAAGGKPPVGINLAQVDPNTLKYQDTLRRYMQQQLGLSDISFGRTPGDSAQMNAQAFAVLASMGTQLASPFQQASFEAEAKVGELYLKTLALNVPVERLLRIVGQDSKGLFSETKWTGKDLAPVETVVIDIGNPLEQSPAGKMQLLETYRQIPGAITAPQQVAQIMETGRLEPVLKGPVDAAVLVKSENEMMAAGDAPPSPDRLEDHVLHAQGHAHVLNSIDAKNNPAVGQAVHTHVMAHYVELWNLPPGADPTMDPLFGPRLDVLLGRAPMDPALRMPPQMGPPPGMGPPGPGGPPAANDNKEPPATGAPPPPGSQPPTPPVEMPENPLTGQQFSPDAGPPLAGAA